MTPPTTPTTPPSPPPTAAEPKDGKPTLLNEKAPAGAPEKYEFKAPEGFELDTEVTTKAGEIFKKMNLSNDQAQQLVDFYVEQSKQASEAPFKLWEETQEAWKNEVKNDPVLGPKLNEVKTTVARAIASLGDAKLAADFHAAMDYTGAGNNPAFIRAFYALAQKITEGAHVAGAGPSPLGQKAPGSAPPSAARALYPNLP